MNTPQSSFRTRSPGPIAAPHAQQTGVITFLAMATLLLAVMFVALALDTGRLWLAKRELQRTADMAALAAARYTGCGSTRAQALGAANNTLAQNKLDSSFGMAFKRGVAGTNKTTGQHTFTENDSEDSNAAQVTLTHTVPASILAAGLFNAGDVNLRATATARGGPPVANFSIGSFASISQNQADFITNLFRGILGNSSLNLGVNALTDLALTSVNLAQLQAIAGAATIDELLDRQVPIDQLFNWLVQASPSSAAASSALKQLGSISLNSGIKVRLRDVLDVQIPAPQAAASVDINLLDLIQTSLLVGNGKGTINMGFNIPLVGGVTLNILNPPKIAMGPAGKYLSGKWCTETKSAQMSLKIGFNPLGIGLLADMALYMDLLATSGHMESLSISPGDNQGVVSVGSTLFSLRLRNNADTAPATLGGGLLQIGLNLPLGDAKGGQARFTVVSDADMPRNVQTSGVGSGTVAGLIGQDTSLVVKVLGLGGDLLNWAVKAFVTPFLTAAANLIIDPLLHALGIDIGFVKVKLNDIDATQSILII